MQQTTFQPLLDARALSRFLSLSPRTLEALVARGEAPPYIWLGRQRRWRQEVVDAWLREQPQQSRTGGETEVSKQQDAASNCKETQTPS